MKKLLTQAEQDVAEKLLEKGLFLVKYNGGDEDRYAVYIKDPSMRENLVNDNILLDTEASLSDLLFELKVIYKVIDYQYGDSEE